MNIFLKCSFGIFVFSLFFIAAISLVPGNVTYADELRKGTVNCDILNSREIPDSNSTVVFKLAQDADVNVIGSYQEWVKITYKEYIGWTKKEFINIGSTPVETPSVQSKTAYINADNVNLRASADINSTINATLPINQQITVYEESNGWTKCKSGDSEGWVKTEFISSSKTTVATNFDKAKTGLTTGTNINVRSKPDVASDSIAKLGNNKKISILASSGDWYSIQSGDIKGWVHKNFIKVLTQKEIDALNAPKNKTSSSSQASVQSVAGNNTAAQLIEYAKTFLGTRYVYGGSSPSGFDCSGFVYYVYKHFGITLNRSSASMASNGTAVSKSNLAPGDLVFFDTNLEGRISHVGIYIGDGKFIQSASGSAMKVIISSLSEPNYSREYVTARRILS